MIISRTPYRVDLIGDGTDIGSFCNKERGCIVNATIQKYIYVIVHPSKDKKINVSCGGETEIVGNVEELKNGRVKEAMKMVGVFGGIEIHSIADAQTGTGLGGSSSFTVGVLNALHKYKGEEVTQEVLAKEASQVEIDILKEPIGRQDQYAAAYGGFNQMEFVNEKVVVSKLINNLELKKEVEEKMMMFSLGEDRSATSILSEQNKEMQTNQRVFDAMRDMRNLADYSSFEIKSGEIENFGKFLQKNWNLKKELIQNINNPSIEEYYNLAIENGAEGAKLSGARGSGFLLVYAPLEKQERIRYALHDLEEHKFELEEKGSSIIYSKEDDGEQLTLNKNSEKEINNMVKGIAFDLEGTVVNLDPLHISAHLEVFRRVGLNLSSEEAMEKIEHFIGGPDSAIMEDVYNLGYTNMSIEEMVKLDKQLYEEQLNVAEISPRPGFLEFLEKIKELEIPYSIGSLTATEQADFILEKSGLYNHFKKDKIVLKENVKNLKPSPDVYLETARKMGIPPENQLVFEDSHNGVKAALAAGSKVIGMPVYQTKFIINRLNKTGAHKVLLGWEGVNIIQLSEEIFKH